MFLLKNKKNKNVFITMLEMSLNYKLQSLKIALSNNSSSLHALNVRHIKYDYLIISLS